MFRIYISVYGLLINNIWSVRNFDNEINAMTFQYFINYNLSKGWHIITSPIITANWHAEEGNQWTVPFDAGGGKIVKLGGIFRHKLFTMRPGLMVQMP